MQLNAFKCNVICIAWARNPIACFYSLCGQVLQEVDTGKYLSAELNWSPHFSGVSSKTNSTLSFLCRYLRKCPQPLRRQQLYISCDPLSSMLPQSKILILPQTSPLRRSSIMIVKGDYRNWPRYGLRWSGWYCHQAQHELCRLRPRRPAQRVLCLMAVPPTTAQTV